MIVLFTGIMVLSQASSGFVMPLDVTECDVIGFAFTEYQSRNLETFPWSVLHRGEVHLHTAVSHVSGTRPQASLAAINPVPRTLPLALSAKDCDGGSLFKLL